MDAESVRSVRRPKPPENRGGTGAWELIAVAHRLGLALRVEGDRLLVSPAAKLPADLRTKLANNAAAVALLLTHGCLRCGSTAWRLALVTDEGARFGCTDCVKSKARGGTPVRAAGGAA